MLCLEWLDPYYVAGHWVPEMVTKAGGEDVLGRAGEPSFRVSSEDIEKAQPEVIVVMPCGYDVARTVSEFTPEKLPENWKDLPAVRERRIFAVDANSYFSRPGPRLSDGVAILAHLFHPEQFPQQFLPSKRFAGCKARVTCIGGRPFGRRASNTPKML